VSAPIEQRRSWRSRHQLLLFFLLAFGLSWSIWPLKLLNPASAAQVPFGPTIAAFVVAALAGGRRPVLELLRRLAHWRVHGLWYVVALGGPFALTTLAAMLAVAAGAPTPSFAGYADWALVAATVAQTAVVVGLFEEPGWRGFALPRMQRSLGGVRAALVLGVIWTLWHLPLLIGDPTGQRPWAPYAVWAVAESVVLAWLYISTEGSLPVVILFHAAVNTSVRYLLPEFAGGWYLLAWWALAGVHVVVALAVVLFAGRDLTRSAPGARAASNGMATAVTSP
jgi:membrane protease YdiL (CAAX protease family)